MSGIKYEEDEVPILCHGCLSSDRRITLIRDDSALFFSLLGDQPQHIFNDARNLLMLCWECIAILRKIQTFQNRIKTTQIILSESLCHIDQPHTLSTLTRAYKDNYDVTIHQDQDIDNKEIEDKDVILNKLAVEIKQEHTTEDNELFDITASVTKEEDDYSDIEDGVDIEDIEYTPQIDEVKHKTPSKNIKKCKDNEHLKKRLSIKRYQQYAKVYFKEKFDLNNLNQYFSNVYLSYDEMEAVMVRDRKDFSFGRMPFKCYICKLGYNRKVDFNRHKACCHNESPPYRCTECKSVSDSHSDLVEHWRRHTHMLKCNKCSHLSRTIGEFKKHINKAHSSVYQCNSCALEFRMLREFSTHYKAYHERVICDYCNKTFVSKESLLKHMKRNHLTPNCPICRRSFNRYGALESHNRMHHPHLVRVPGDATSESAYCVECDKQFPSVYRYKRHIAQSAVHTPRKRVRVPCPDCGKVFTRKNYMNNHYRQIHSKVTKFHCEICDKYFATGFGLRNHRKYVHEKVAIPKTKICEVCGRVFSTNRILDNHRRTHTGERPFKCEYCPASFGQQTAMKTHQKTQHKNVLT